jgi:hypothetical protein
MSRTTIITAEPAARFSGPPADRMAGRPSRMAQAKAAAGTGNYKPKEKPASAQVSAATVARASSFLDREALLDAAMHQGVIGGGLRAHYGECYDADPEGTRSYLQGLGLRDGGVQPASSAASSDAYDESALSRSERRRITAAREGRQSTQVISGGL